MSDHVRVLVLEDNPDDAELTLIELQRAGLEPSWIRVETEAEFVAALQQDWDLILADNNLPTFDGISALRRVAELGVQVPFIIVSGSIGEEDAVAAMQSGASDYVLKDRLARLGQAARRALERREDQVRRADAEQRVQQLERLRYGVELATDIGGSLDPEDVLERVLRRLVVAVAADAGLLLAPGAGRDLLVRAIHDPGRLLPYGAGDTLQPEGVVAAALRQDSKFGGAFGGLDLAGLEHAAAVALRSGDASVVLAVGRAEQPFTTAELETLELIGSVAALALRNAELFSAAKSASQAKSEFLNMAAHELRTPLSVISGYVSLLSDGSFGAPDARWLEVVDILNAKAVELSRLVDSLLIAARLESTEFGGRRERLDLVELASEALQRAEPRARLLQATVLLDAPGGAVAAEVDAEQVGRIFDNLIDNALTYAGERPWVRVSVDPSGRIEVEDSGPGIPEHLRERVFERFYRVNDPARAPQPGTGLGLYIARELAERNGGSLELTDSSVGTGARFVLQLTGLPLGAGTIARAEPALEAQV